MKKWIRWILITFCAFGLTNAYYVHNEIIEPPLNYNGAKRSHCPARIYKQSTNRQDTSLRLKQLRSEMSRVVSVQGPPLDGYIVTSNDAHQSDSLDPHDMRREYITGFYGSAGDALITLDKAVLWTDGRYHIHADHQLDCNWILMKRGRANVAKKFNLISQLISYNDYLIKAARTKEN